MSPFQFSSTVAISELGQLKVYTSPEGYPTLSTIEAQKGGGGGGGWLSLLTQLSFILCGRLLPKDPTLSLLYTILDIAHLCEFREDFSGGAAIPRGVYLQLKLTPSTYDVLLFLFVLKRKKMI